MTQNIQVSKKLDDGTIVVLGGTTYDEFLSTASAVLGDDNAAALANSFANLLPASAGGVPPQAAPTYQQVAQQFPQAQPVQQAPTGAPGPAPIGANGRPQKWVPPGVSKRTGRPYSGFFADDNPRY